MAKNSFKFSDEVFNMDYPAIQARLAVDLDVIAQDQAPKSIAERLAQRMFHSNVIRQTS